LRHFVSDFERILWLEPSGVVDQNVDIARGGQDGSGALCRCDVARRCVEARAGGLGL